MGQPLSIEEVQGLFDPETGRPIGSRINNFYSTYGRWKKETNARDETGEGAPFYRIESQNEDGTFVLVDPWGNRSSGLPD